MSSDSAKGLRAVCGAFVGLSILTTGTRFYARRHSKAFLGADDWIIIGATVSYIATAGCVLAMVSLGQLGYPSTHLSPTELVETAKPFSQLLIAFDTLLTLCLACIKMSILFFFRRIFCVHGRAGTFYILTTCTIYIVICWLIAFEFLAWFQCGIHLSALWDGNYDKYCTVSFPYLYGLAISDFLLDVSILALPFPQILRLHTTPAKKASIIGVFLLAFVGLGASIARMVEYIGIVTGGVGGVFSTDRELSLTVSAYLAMLEAGMSLVAANLPSLWLILTKTIPESVMRSVGSILSLRSLGRSDGRVSDGREIDSEALRNTSRPSGVSTSGKSSEGADVKIPKLPKEKIFTK